MFRFFVNPAWRDLRNLGRDFNRVFGEIFRTAPYWEGESWYPPIDMVELDDAYVVNVELPGVNQEDVKINFQNHILTISGEKRQETDKKAHYQSECFYGPFRRSITLPGEINPEKIVAKFQHGILQITLPKIEEAKAREIKIEVN